MNDYPSIREWVRNEYLLPSLVIGVPEDIFWKQTPITIQLYFKADKAKQQRNIQMAWLQGIYVKRALQSTILAAALADDKVAKNMPKYPECPYNEQESSVELTEEQKQKERDRLYMYYKAFAKINNANNRIKKNG